ncbi:MAG: hypothetical protein COB84_08515 [Rhodobacteraceae bacterium]|nr:MAG: hypothetical protein COB84_08515 [Paracoccaceae bacterium]
MSKLTQIFKRFLKNQRGSATIEFVIAFPFLFGMIVLTFDSGIMMAKYVVLENALDRVVRDVRLFGTASGVAGHAAFKQAVCDRAILIANCESTLIVEMTPIATGSAMTPPSGAACANRGANSVPVINFTGGGANDIVYIRACVIVDRYFPSLMSSVFPTDASGGIALVASSAYVVEP